MADTLSRLIEEIQISKEDILGFETTEFDSPEYQDLISTLSNNKEKFPDIKVSNGLVFKKKRLETEENDEFKWKLWIPSTLTYAMINEAHENIAHGGIRKTLDKLREKYYWPNMIIQVKQYVINCTICKETKPTNINLKPSIGEEVVTDRPFQKLYIDFLGKYPRSKNGNSYIFIVVDHMTKFVFLKAMKEATASNVVKFLREQVFHIFGVPETIHSDNGQQFLSKEFANMIGNYRINHMRTAVHSPQSNASERVNQSVLAAIRSYLGNDNREWDLNLPGIELALRTAVHSPTGVIHSLHYSVTTCSLSDRTINWLDN